MPAGRGDVVVLDQGRVAERHAVVDAAAAADGVLLQRPQARRGLAGVADRGAGARRRRPTHCRVSVATPERWPTRFRAVRSAVSSDAGRAGDGEHGLARARRPRRRRRAATTSTAAPPTRSKTAAATGTPGEHARRPRDDVTGGAASGGHGGVRRDVRAEARGPPPGRGGRPARPRPGRARPAARAVGELGAQTPRRSCDHLGARRASGPARCGCARARRGRAGAPGGPATRAGSPGASARRWQPRLSVRASAAAASRVATVCSAVVSTRRERRAARVRAEPGRRRAARPARSARRRRGGRRRAGSSAAVIAARAAGSIALGRPPAVDRRRRRRAGRRPAASAQRRAATSPSVIEFDASRLAPWTPVHATSPTAKRPGTRRAAVEVGEHPAAGVVRGRHDRHRLAGQVEPACAAGARRCRGSGGRGSRRPGAWRRGRRGRRRSRAGGRRSSAETTSRGARSASGWAPTMIRRPVARRRARRPRRAPPRRPAPAGPRRRRPGPQHGRVELHHLDVGDLGAGPQREGEPVAGGARPGWRWRRRPGRSRRWRARRRGPAGRRRRRSAPSSPMRAMRRPTTRPSAVRQRVEGDGVLEHLDAAGAQRARRACG